MTIIVLQSADGQDYAWPVIAPEALSVSAAIDKAGEIIEKVHAEDPEEWGGRLTELLEAEGFQVPGFAQGPVWD